ncbi:MAG: hypothetical protein Q4C55_01045 [Eubacterium sp.]|nr:hypothetical protein [Eubacterium sp.]
MMRNALLLFKTEFILASGFNRVRHTKDAKEKRRLIAMGILYVFLGIVLCFYSSLLAFGYAYLGLADRLPALMLFAVSALSFILTFLKVGGVLFAPKNYDQLLSLPLTTGAVIAGKLLGIYLFNFLMGCLLMLPGLITFGLCCSVSGPSAIILILLPFLAPLLPITIAALLSALTTALAARFKRSNLVAALFNLLLLMVILGASLGVSSINEGQLSSLANMVSKGVDFYPPAKWVDLALNAGNFLAFLGFLVLSLGSMALFGRLLARFYTRLNSALAAHQSGARIQWAKLRTGSPFRALYTKELRRLLSLNIYLVNTCFGALLLVVFGIAACVVDFRGLLTASGAPISWDMVAGLLPLALAFIAAMSSTTYPAISLEGASRWIPASIPVESRVIYNAKLAVNLTILLPAVLLSAVLVGLGTQASLWQMAVLIVTPAAYGCLSAVLGLFLNQRYPRYDWATEYQAVKGGSIPAFATFGIGFLVALIPLGICAALPSLAAIIAFVFGLLILAISLLLYRSLIHRPYFAED